MDFPSRLECPTDLCKVQRGSFWAKELAKHPYTDQSLLLLVIEEDSGTLSILYGVFAGLELDSASGHIMVYPNNVYAHKIPFSCLRGITLLDLRVCAEMLNRRVQKGPKRPLGELSPSSTNAIEA